MRVIEVEKHGETTWINIQDGSAIDIGRITERYAIHSLHTHPIINNLQLSQLVAERHYLFVLLCQPYSTHNKERIATKPIAVYIGANFLITIHSSKTPAPKALFDELKAKRSPEINSPARIAFHLITRLLTDLQAQTEDVSLRMDRIENKVFDASRSDSVEIGRLRQQIIRLRRCLVGQKTVLEELHESINKFSHEDLRRYYVSNTNMSRRLWETVEEAKETIEVYKDVDFTANNDRTNRILAILTLIFTLSIPGTLLGAFYGMNIAVPGAITTNRPWTFLGPYTTFIIVVAITLLSGVIMFAYFKRKRWF